MFHPGNRASLRHYHSHRRPVRRTHSSVGALAAEDEPPSSWGTLFGHLFGRHGDSRGPTASAKDSDASSVRSVRSGVSSGVSGDGYETAPEHPMQDGRPAIRRGASANSVERSGLSVSAPPSPARRPTPGGAEDKPDANTGRASSPSPTTVSAKSAGSGSASSGSEAVVPSDSPPMRAVPNRPPAAPPAPQIGPRKISHAELAEHRGGSSVWLAYRGTVYDVTAFAARHPGGLKEIMRGAGKDATQLIYDAHPWINIERLLGHRAVVGVLERSGASFLAVPKLW